MPRVWTSRQGEGAGRMSLLMALPGGESRVVGRQPWVRSHPWWCNLAVPAVYPHSTPPTMASLFPALQAVWRSFLGHP